MQWFHLYSTVGDACSHTYVLHSMLKTVGCLPRVPWFVTTSTHNEWEVGRSVYKRICHFSTMKQHTSVCAPIGFTQPRMSSFKVVYFFIENTHVHAENERDTERVSTL